MRLYPSMFQNVLLYDYVLYPTLESMSVLHRHYAYVSDLIHFKCLAHLKLSAQFIEAFYGIFVSLYISIGASSMCD